MCRDNTTYANANSFDPSRYLTPSSPLYREPLTEFPKIQGHTVFGWGRRVCIGQEYAATQMLVVCASVASAFNMTLDTPPQGLEDLINNSTPNIIPIMDGEGLGLKFNARNEQTARWIREEYAAQRALDIEQEEDECL